MHFKARFKFAGRNEHGQLCWERVTRYSDGTGLYHVADVDWFYGMMVKR